MTLGGRGPWWVSAALHLVLGAGALVLLVQEPRSPEVLRMRLVAAPGAPTPEPARATWVPPSSRTTVATSVPKLPVWRGDSPASPADPVAPVTVSLDELLGPPSEAPVLEAPHLPSVEAGWTGPGGLGYTPPPLPPPGMSPPQGARWLLKLSIPGGGGFARFFEGLDSGHPDLDRWLEEYLRTVSFPSSPDGEDYVVRWNLRLETGRPQ